MTDPQKPYEVDSGDAGTPGQPADPGKARPIDFPSPAQPKGKIDAPELLSGFEEDADFDKDPEVDRVILGKPVQDAPASLPPSAPEEFVTPGLGGAKVWAIVGGALLVMAMIASAMQPAGGTSLRLLRVLLVLYNTLLHTGTGVVAVFVAATLLGKRLGKFELAAARMFASVGAFALLMSIQFRLFGVDGLDRLVVLICASGAYILLVATTFNVWQRYPLLYIIGSHFFLWLIVAVGMLLSQLQSQRSSAAPPAARSTATPSAPAATPGVKPATPP